MSNDRDSNNVGMLLRQQRVTMMLTIRELSALSGVSSSHLSRIEKGHRFPSASVLRRIAAPLGFNETELFCLTGYLSPGLLSTGKENSIAPAGQLDPYVAEVLAREPVPVQRTVIGLVSILKSIAGAPQHSSGISQ